MITKSLNWKHPQLSKRLSEIMYSMCYECNSTKETADKLCISEHTVASHKKEIFRTFGITKITELSKIFFTMSVLSAVFGLHGVIENQSRGRLSSVQRNVITLSSRMRSRRREQNENKQELHTHTIDFLTA